MTITFPPLGGSGEEFAQAQGSGAPASAAVSGTSFGLIPSIVAASFLNVVPAGDRTYFVPIFVPSDRNVDGFTFHTGGSALTNDIELGLFEQDTTGLKLGTKVIGATQTSSFSATTYTEVGFASTAVVRGWHLIGVSGIGTAAPPSLEWWDYPTVDHALPVIGYGIDNLVGGDLEDNGYFEASQDLDGIVAGQALTMPTATIIKAIPFLWLRNA